MVRGCRRRGRSDKTVAVVGDGAVGLMGVLAARQFGVERIIAMSRHAGRQALARGFGATDIVTERGDEGVAQIKELTGGLGAHSVIEAVGTQQSMMQAIRSARPGGHVGFVGVSHDVQLSGDELFFAEVHLHGGPAPVRRFLSELIELIWDRKINPGKVFDLTLPLEEAADGYRAMDRRDAIKVLLQPWRQDGRPLNDLVRRSRGAAGGRRPVGAHPPTSGSDIGACDRCSSDVEASRGYPVNGNRQQAASPASDGAAPGGSGVVRE
jgi:threonine dehydrogenase-like Zn-dependent dehydrogenase